MPRARKPEGIIAIEGRRGHKTKAEIADRQRSVGYSVGDTAPPAGLTGLALETWENLADQMTLAGILKNPTRIALEGMCRAYAQAVAADTEIAEEGFYVLTEKGHVARPAWKISQDCWMRVKAFAMELGMTPASESKVVAPQAPTSNPIEDAMCG